MLDQTNNNSIQYQQEIKKATDSIGLIILGKPEKIKLAICCLLAKGHCLIEDLPGVGKTTLSQTIAKVFGLEFNRIQFTSDLLPADILGVSIFDSKQQQFRFHPGPVFTHFVLADEINRATPKTQSALLEAMEERQVTVEGETRLLEQPFFVIGTQNPLDQSGTFPLPESQLDRFMMKLELGYPDKQAERALLSGSDRRELLKNMKPQSSVEQLCQIQQFVENIHISEPLLDYVQDLISATRNPAVFIYGLSPRAGLAVIRAAKSWALINGRDYVEPGDVKAIFEAVSSHRLTPSNQQGQSSSVLIQQLLDSVPIP